MFYSCGIKVSNPGKSRYTNHHGMSMNRGGADRNEAPISEGKVSDFQGDLHIKKEVSKAPQRDDIFWFFAIWGLILVGSILWFVFSLYLKWALWIVITSGIFLGAVLSASIVLILIIGIFNGL